MISKTPPREFTNSRIIYDKMKFSYENGNEFDITDLENDFGDIIPRSTIAQSVSRLTSEYFTGCRFYTRTVDGRLMLGCHTPKNNESSASILGMLNN